MFTSQEERKWREWYFHTQLYNHYIKMLADGEIKPLTKEDIEKVVLYTKSAKNPETGEINDRLL